MPCALRYDCENTRPHPKCRWCEGSNEIRFVFWQGRYRTRVDVARWFLAQREWRGADVRAHGSNLYLRKGSSLMRLEHFTPDELAALTRRAPEPECPR